MGKSKSSVKATKSEREAAKLLYKFLIDNPDKLCIMKINKEHEQEFAEHLEEARRVGDWLLSREPTTKKNAK